MKFLKAALILPIAAFAIFAMGAINSQPCFEQGKSYTFFTGHTSADCKVITTYGNAAIKKLTLEDVCGESTVYESLDINSFLNKVDGKIMFTESLSDSVNYYCTADLPYSAMLYGQEINLHICLKDSGVTVASPIIFGGY